MNLHPAMTIAIVCCAFTLPAAAGGPALVGRASVVDGDTIEISGTRIRLHGIDAPEKAQTCKDAGGKDYRCGQRAALALDEYLAQERPTRCEPKGFRPLRPDYRLLLPLVGRRRRRMAGHERQRLGLATLQQRSIRRAAEVGRGGRCGNLAGTIHPAMGVAPLEALAETQILGTDPSAGLVASGQALALNGLYRRIRWRF